MKILHISHSDLRGGAARAAYRLHLAQLSADIESRMLVRNKLSDSWTIQGPSSILEKGLNQLRPSLGNQINKLQRSHNTNFHSGNWLPSNWAKKINSSNADIVNLHWIAGETMSIQDIGNIKKPIVWTLHDMWPFCGTEHVTGYEYNARWKTGYFFNNRGSLEKGIDLDRLAWRQKVKAWKKQVMHIVAPSHWMAECAKSSLLFQNYSVEVIPNALNLNVYRPLDKNYSRHILNLPNNKEIILFGAMGGGKDNNKGYDLLLKALNYLSISKNHNDILCVIFGQSEPEYLPDIPFETKWLGHINDDVTLALLYNSATVMIVPSRQENLPQTATEAQACGIPVIAFDTTGIKDVIEHQKTGYLVKPFDTMELAQAMKWILENVNVQDQLGKNAREKALKSWNEEIIAKKYINIYNKIIPTT
ncbi:glycosyl transferase [Providencia heimbachae]|uniref:glycosyltransferase family 4 protein n=1 Tax=Providencia heimbachae TaxID=333962 RepID=UPI0010BE2939|nr:glycosyltransferase family 4 protein [Providencia heimbachae]QCJ71833.1 glycosyl transferase [Providencia heimbachae]